MSDGPIHRYRALVARGAIEPDQAQLPAVETLQVLHSRLDGYRPGEDKGGLRGLFRIGRPDPAPKGLYIFGSVGRGKSMLMDLFFDTAPVRDKRRVHFHAFMGEIHEAIHRHRQRLRRGEPVDDDPIPPVAAEVARTATLLCFDEFQVTDVADAMILSRLFEQFFEHGMVIVTTSNTAPDDLYLGGLNRPLFLPFIEMIRQRLDVLHLDGGRDHRMGRLLARPIYHHPLGPEADAAMDRAWAEAAAGLEIGPECLTVKGHEVRVPLAARGSARFGFGDLCGRAHGAGDYLSLALRYGTIFVDGIPVLSAERRDEARRLVILVDAVYEAGGLIVASAEAPPEALVPSGAEASGFARTASRLHEMRSAAYLSGRDGSG
jgi:cell division protein ZapE